MACRPSPAAGTSSTGLNHTSYVVEYTANPECMSHYTFSRVVRLNGSSQELTLAQLYERAQQDLSSPAVILEFSRDIIYQLVCPHCSEAETLLSSGWHGVL